MKPIAILTSLLTLSACGGGFFWFDVPEIPTPATISPEEVNAINQQVTMLPTELDGYTIADVTFVNTNGEAHSFVLDSDNRIEGFIRNYDGKHYTREGDSNVFVNDEKDYRHKYESFDDSHKLQYSDFGVFEREDYFNDNMVFVGGYNSKRIDSPTDLYDGSNPMFVGSAVAILKRVGSDEGIIAKTDDAYLTFNTKGYELSMPFYSAPAGGDVYYDVYYDSVGDKLIFKGDCADDYRWNGGSGGWSTFADVHVAPKAYGNNGVTSEVVGMIGTTGKDQYDQGLKFEAAYGMTKK